MSVGELSLEIGIKLGDFKSVELHSSTDRRLLIVDDTPGIHEDFRKILREDDPSEYDRLQDEMFSPQAGLPKPKRLLIDSAYQGEQALELVTRAVKAGRPYALAFVDVRMPPGWDGVETARRLWEIDLELQIVICTAYSDFSWSEMSRTLGQMDNLVFLKKPFDPSEILVLTDIGMPGGISGRALVERLRVFKPDLKIVFMSGYLGEIGDGANVETKQIKERFLRKPCSREELLQVVRKYLDEGKNSNSIS